MNEFETPPVFYRDQFLAAPDINTLERNCAFLDQMAYRREPVFDSMPRKGDPSSSWHTINGYLLWRGSVFYQSFHTSLSIFGRTQGTIAGTARVKVFINGVLQSTTTPSIGNWTVSISLSGKSYTPDFPLVIEIYTYGLGATDRSSEWWIYYVGVSPSYLSPTLSDPSLPVIGSSSPPTNTNNGRPWVGMQNFNGIYNETALNIISNNQLHLFDRMNQVPLVGNRSYLNSVMNHDVGDWEIWTGGVIHTSPKEVYRLNGSVTLLAVGNDSIKIYMNDVLVDTIGPFTTVGTHLFNKAILFTVAAPTTVRVKLVWNNTVFRNPSLSSRLDIIYHRTDPFDPGFPVLTPPYTTIAATNYHATQTNNVLNRVIFMMNAIKTRVDNSLSFRIVRACRDNFGYDERGRRSLDQFHPITFQRRGNRLVIYGKNVQLGFGGRVYELDADNHATYKYKFSTEQTLVGGDKYELKTIYLDSIKGLCPGDIYYVQGDCTFAAEYHL